MRAFPATAGRWDVTAALLAVQLLFAVHYVAAKWLLETIPPPAWAALRVGGAAVVLLLLTPTGWRRVGWSPRRVARIGVLCLFGVVLNQILFLEGLSRTVASHSALINTSIPVTTLLFASLLGRERLTRLKVTAVVLSLSGVWVLLAAKGLDLDRGTLHGDLLCLGNATSFSLFLALAPPVLRGLPVRNVTALLFTFGSVGVGIYGWPALRDLDWSSVGAVTWWTGAAIVLGPTVGAYFLNNWALARTDPSRVALFIYLQFVLAAPLSWLLLTETPTWRLLPAAVLVLAGLVLVSGSPTHLPSAPPGLTKEPPPDGSGS